MKLNRIEDLRTAIDNALIPGMGNEEDDTIEFDYIILQVVDKISSSACAHPPTWCKELKRGYKIITERYYP